MISSRDTYRNPALDLCPILVVKYRSKRSLRGCFSSLRENPKRSSDLPPPSEIHDQIASQSRPYLFRSHTKPTSSRFLLKPDSSFARTLRPIERERERGEREGERQPLDALDPPTPPPVTALPIRSEVTPF
ncbi:hypothetical protein MA16_Dca004835 [Dendrobium catenatum]|uniref:Uncharacterized protein n=1 Tax=Dendrobium catenatum TaxID=906689 RepID=A0A2I0WG43_9ASPA|nr:hypothetical protein MA16_Dca004835 [Dendrobium catenatum]